MTNAGDTVSRVLFVDPAADRRAAVVDALTDAAFDVRTVTGGSTTPAALDGDDFDCVVYSHDPPAADVFDGRVSLAADVPVVVYAVAPIDAGAALSLGAADVVESDDPALLAHRIRSVVDARRDPGMRERERLTALFSNTSDCIVECDLDGDRAIVRRANQAFADVFGGDPGSLVGADLDELVLAPDERTNGHDINRRVREGERVQAEVTRRAVDGPREFLLRSVRLFGDAQPRAYFVYTDVTARKRREEMLRSLTEATQRLMAAETRVDIADCAVEAARTVLGFPGAAVHLVGDNGQLEPTSTSGGSSLGAPPGAVDVGAGVVGSVFERGEATTVTDLDAADVAAPALSPMDAAAVVAVPLGDHGVLTVGSTDADAFDDETAEFVRVLGANTAEALERADREAELRKREAELRTERDRFRALFENVPDPAVNYRFDEDGRMVVIAVNPAFERVMGYDADEVLGEDLDEFIVPADRTDEADDFNEMLRAGETFHDEVRREAATGVRDFLLHGVPYRVGERSVLGYAIYTDTTEQKRRERELKRQNERLAEFASIVSHDLRNPLNVAQGRMELLAEEFESEDVREVDAALSRMQELVSGLLTLAREGRAVRDPQPVDPTAVADRALASVSAQGVSFSCRECPRVSADPERLRTLFENLFRNSIEHGGDDVTITVGPLEDRAGFFVADDGPGIPEADRERVFEHGFTTDEGGTGFGLAIVETIVDAHGWTVRVTESESGGARFEVAGVERV